MTRYVALLRAVNLGGGSSMPMADLRAVLTGLGLDDVATYVQSGNAVFGSDAGEADLVARIEAALADRFDRPIAVLLRSAAELAAIAAANPFAGRQDDPRKLSVTFLAAPPAPDRTEVAVPDQETGELALAGRDVYVHTPDGYGRTRLGNAFLERRLGVAATTRNWRSVLTLRDMAAG